MLKHKMIAGEKILISDHGSDTTDSVKRTCWTKLTMANAIRDDDGDSDGNTSCLFKLCQVEMGQSGLSAANTHTSISENVCPSSRLSH